jgi:ribosomal protein L11 methyltransferase
VAAALCDLGALGVSVETAPPGAPPPDPVRIRAFFDGAAGLPPADRLMSQLVLRSPACAGARLLATSTLQDGRWVERWIEALAPFPVGERFVVEPVKDLDDFAGRIPLRICPSRAFGTGEHPTTRLCLMEMEKLRLAGRSFLDAGTGSGILAVAAALLGALKVVAFDNDAEAIEVARANAALNPAAIPITFLVGEPGTIPAARYDAVAANLNGAILARVLPDLARLAAPGGRMILSGLLDAEVEEISGLALSLGLRSLRTTSLEGWACSVHEAPRA